MPYATPNHYAQAFGLQELAQQLQDEELLLESANLQAGLAALAAGAVVTDTHAQRALDRLQAKLSNISNFMDGYLRNAMALPITGQGQVLGVLQECCLALTREAIADDSDNITEHVTNTADRWRKWLRDIAARKVALVSDDGNTSNSSGGRVVVGKVAPAVHASTLQSFGGGYRV